MKWNVCDDRTNFAVDTHTEVYTSIYFWKMEENSNYNLIWNERNFICRSISKHNTYAPFFCCSWKWKKASKMKQTEKCQLNGYMFSFGIAPFSIAPIYWRKNNKTHKTKTKTKQLKMQFDFSLICAFKMKNKIENFRYIHILFVCESLMCFHHRLKLNTMISIDRWWTTSTTRMYVFRSNNSCAIGFFYYYFF